MLMVGGWEALQHEKTVDLNMMMFLFVLMLIVHVALMLMVGGWGVLQHEKTVDLNMMMFLFVLMLIVCLLSSCW